MNLRELNSSMLSEVNRQKEIVNKVLANQNGTQSNVICHFDVIGDYSEKIKNTREFMQKVRLAYKLNKYVQSNRKELKEGQVSFANSYINPYRKYFKDVEKEMEADEKVNKLSSLHDEISTLIGRSEFEKVLELSDEYLNLRDEVKAIAHEKNGLNREQSQKVSSIIVSNNKTFTDVHVLLKARDTGKVEDFTQFTSEYLAELRDNFNEMEKEMISNTSERMTKQVNYFKKLMATEGTNDLFDGTEVERRFRQWVVQSYCDFCPFYAGQSCPIKLSKCISKFGRERINFICDNVALNIGNAVRVHNSIVKRVKEGRLEIANELAERCKNCISYADEDGNVITPEIPEQQDSSTSNEEKPVLSA